jgi:acetyl esterase
VKSWPIPWLLLGAWAQAEEAIALRGVLIDWERAGVRGEFSVRATDFRVWRCRFDERTEMERIRKPATADAMRVGDWIELAADREADIPICYARSIKVITPARESIIQRPLASTRGVMDHLYQRGSLALGGLVLEVTTQRLVLRTRGRAEQSFRLRPDTSFTRDGLPSQASAVARNSRVFVRAGKGWDGELEAYSVTWGEILRSERPVAVEPREAPPEAGLASYVYKTDGKRELSLKVAYPPGWAATEAGAAMLLFEDSAFGARDGDGALAEEAAHWAARGLVAVRVESRRPLPGEATPENAVEDARSAMRWARRNAAALGVDGERIVAFGNFAGAHLAAGLAALNHINAEGEDLFVSTRPAALLLQNPVFDWLDSGSLADRLMGLLNEDKRRAARLSPARYWRADMPPALVVVGAKDAEPSRRFVARWKAQGAEIELFEGEGGPAVSLLAPRQDKALARSARFLESLGFVRAPATPEGVTSRLAAPR